MYWNKSEKWRKNDKMAQVALNQKHNAIGREKRRWKRQKNDKLRRLEQKNLHKTKKLTWKNKEETEEKCWKQFYNIRFLKCGYKKKKKTGCRRMRNIFDSLEREHAIVKNRPDHWRHQEETRAWDGASFTPPEHFACLACQNVEWGAGRKQVV